jgi:hypothetical protein
MTKAGKLIYNCKRCGAIIRLTVPDMYAALTDGSTGELPNVMHTCNEVQVGLTELVGADYDEDKPN